MNIFSDNNIMLAALISLLLLILFLLLLHLYANCFFFQPHSQPRSRRHRRRRHRITTVTVSDFFGPSRFHHFHSFNMQDSPLSTSLTKGLDSSIIASIPIFMYKAAEEYYDVVGDDKVEQELLCVVCLSGFEDGEMGKCLPKCRHGFHVECIDMWLSSHSNCPICRVLLWLWWVIMTLWLMIRENENGNDDVGLSHSLSQASSFLFVCSSKRILRKVFHSSYVNEFQS